MKTLTRNLGAIPLAARWAMLATTAMLLCLGNPASAQSEKYHCDVANFQSITPDKRIDDSFTRLNLEKKYEITIQAKSILTTFAVEGRTFSNEYTIDAVGLLYRFGSRSSETSLDSIALALKPDPYYG